MANVTAQKKFCWYTFISMQLNFPVLSMFSCVAPRNAGFMETEYFLKRWYLRTSLLQATLLPHSVHIDKTKEIIFACTR